MATGKLYYEDPHLHTFTAAVVSCEASSHGYDVILDRTAFYPEGGGQSGDTGILGGVRVTDTHERGEDIVHYCAAPLPVGQTVEGVLDYDRRFSFMQLHSGEHILSGLIHQRFGYDNVGFHMGADMVTIDFSGPISEEELAGIEAAANEIVWKDLPVEIAWPTPEELAAIPYRSKKALTGAVRIVTIPGADICACCGTHVQHTGEIGLIKIFSSVKFHEGVRLEILCGRRAYDYVNLLVAQNRITSNLLSAKPVETSDAVRRTLEELAAGKLRAAQLEDRLFSLKAGELAGCGNVLVFEDGLSADGVRRLADRVMHTCGGRAAVFSGSDGSGFKYAVAEENGDVRAFVKAMNQALNGRGGGKPFFAQGSVQAGRDQIEAYFREV